MALDPSIILSGQGVNALGALSAGNDAAARQNEYMRQRAYQNMLAQNGPGIMAGDQGALNALAGYDPAAALDVQNTRLNMDSTRQDMAWKQEDLAMRRAEAKQAAADKLAKEAAAMDAATLAAEKEKLNQTLSGAAYFYQRKDKAGYDAFLRGQGIDPAQYAFDMFPAYAAMGQGVMDAFEAFAPPPPPTPLSKEGKLAADISAGLVPQGTTATPETVIQMGGDKFADEFAKNDATALATIETAGMAASRNISRIDQLGALLAQNPTGAGAAITQLAGEFGIDIGGLDQIQAAQALINSLVPEQRQPGSGPMSDADLALFKQSLPRIINSPGGNQIIVDTMRAIAQYDAEGAQIVQAFRNGELTRSEVFAKLRARKNPLDGFKGAPAAPAEAPQGGQPVQITNDAEYDALPPGTVFTGPDGKTRKKP